MTSINASSSLYFRQVSGTNYYSSDNTNWTQISSYPVTINNTASPTVLNVYFTTNMTLTGVSQYFSLSSNGFSINGLGYTVTISNVANYPGLFTIPSGYKNITVANFKIVASGTTTLASYGGWLFGDSCAVSVSSGSFTITNCSSNGAIPDYSGGIIGRSFLQGSSNCTLTMTNCFTTGTIGAGAGGLTGYLFMNTTTNCSTTIQNCYSLGSIGNSGGGIVGLTSNSTPTGSTITVQNCYGLGDLGTGAGGIVGSGARLVTVSNCYSTGAGNTNSGGIIGQSSNTCTVMNCYITGTSSTTFVGASATSPTILNSYSEAANSSSGWISSRASTVLTSYGTVWISVSTNTPWYLLSYNAQIYQSIIQTSKLTSTTISSTTGLFTSPYVYALISPPANFSINSSTGSITATNQTIPQTYTFYVIVSNGGSNYDYNINLFTYITLNPDPKAVLGFSGTKVINTIYDAKRRTRAGGAVAPKKKGAYPGQSIF